MSNSNYMNPDQASIGKQVKKYAICALIAAFVTLILSAVAQFLWFKYDEIISTEWLYISADGYKDEHLSWIRLFQSTLFQKSILILSLVSLAIFVIYMVYDVIRTIREEGASVSVFIAKTVAVTVVGAIATAIHCLADFLGIGGFTYDNGLYLLEERSFLPIGGYEYQEVWSVFPKLNVGIYVFLFLMIVILFLSIYLAGSLIRLLSQHTTQVASIAAGVAAAVIAVGLPLLTRASNIIVGVIAVAVFAFTLVILIVSERMEQKKAEMMQRSASSSGNNYSYKDDDDESEF